MLLPQSHSFCHLSALPTTLDHVQEKDADGRSDEELANEAWSNYRARNNSFIVDHFQVRTLKALNTCH